MSSLSAGKIQVENLSVAGLGAGAIKARNLKFENLDVSGNLTVQGAQVATQSFVSSAVQGVIGSAGAALNTLGEIQAALGDDANLASTLTTSIATKANAADVTSGLALKADAADAALTGIPTAPTAVVGTNTAQLATTAFVNNSIVRAQKSVQPNDLNGGIMYHVWLPTFNNNYFPQGLNSFNGAFKGVTDKLDYIKSLGATSIWLSPFFKANTDHGYDTIDYRLVNDYSATPSNGDHFKHKGTLAELQELLDAANAKGIQMIIDYACFNCNSLGTKLFGGNIEMSLMGIKQLQNISSVYKVGQVGQSDHYTYAKLDASGEVVFMNIDIEDNVDLNEVVDGVNPSVNLRVVQFEKDANFGYTKSTVSIGGNSYDVPETTQVFRAFTSGWMCFDMKKPETIKFHGDNIKYWADKGFSGARLDVATYELDSEDTSEVAEVFSEYIRKSHPNFVLLPEIFDYRDVQNISTSYGGSLNFDEVFDFQNFDVSKQRPSSKEMTSFVNKYTDRYGLYKDTLTVRQLRNHDVARLRGTFQSNATRDGNIPNLSFSLDKPAGVTGNINATADTCRIHSDLGKNDTSIVVLYTWGGLNGYYSNNEIPVENGGTAIPGWNGTTRKAILPTGTDDYGLYWDLPYPVSVGGIPNFIIVNEGGNKYTGDITNAPSGLNIWSVGNSYYGPMTENLKKYLLLLNGLHFMLPGVPHLYNGEEIGMVSKPDTFFAPGTRDAMVWNNGSLQFADYYGIVSNIADGAGVKATPTVEEQEADQDSFLSNIKAITKTRANSIVLRKGDFKMLVSNKKYNMGENVVAFKRSYGGMEYFCAFNVASNGQTSTVDASGASTFTVYGYVSDPTSKYNDVMKAVDVKYKTPTTTVNVEYLFNGTSLMTTPPTPLTVTSNIGANKLIIHVRTPLTMVEDFNFSLIEYTTGSNPWFTGMLGQFAPTITYDEFGFVLEFSVSADKTGKSLMLLGQDQFQVGSFDSCINVDISETIYSNNNEVWTSYQPYPITTFTMLPSDFVVISEQMVAYNTSKRVMGPQTTLLNPGYSTPSLF
jgi:glycosidase